jgi:hypothetical protein
MSFCSPCPGEPNICGAALMQRMFGIGGTGKLMMRLSDAVLFEEPIEHRNIQDVASLSELQLLQSDSSELRQHCGPVSWTPSAREAHAFRCS